MPIDPEKKCIEFRFFQRDFENSVFDYDEITVLTALDNLGLAARITRFSCDSSVCTLAVIVPIIGSDRVIRFFGHREQMLPLVRFAYLWAKVLVKHGGVASDRTLSQMEEVVGVVPEHIWKMLDQEDYDRLYGHDPLYQVCLMYACGIEDEITLQRGAHYNVDDLPYIVGCWSESELDFAPFLDFFESDDDEDTAAEG